MTRRAPLGRHGAQSLTQSVFYRDLSHKASPSLGHYAALSLVVKGREQEHFGLQIADFEIQRYLKF